MQDNVQVNIGLRLPALSLVRLGELAVELGVSRNRAMSILIDAAVIESRPRASVRLKRDKLSDLHDEEEEFESSGF